MGSTATHHIWICHCGHFQGVTKRDGVTLHTRWVSYDELENISIVTSRIHDQKSTRTPQVTLKRAASHLRQYYTQTWCDIGVLPDYFIKIRDDAIPLFRINWYTVLRYTRRSSKMVVTQHCASWHGLNDKIAIVGGSNHSISKYIYAPFSRYHQATPRWVMNPETYLLYVMMQEGFVQYSRQPWCRNKPKNGKMGRAYIRAVWTSVRRDGYRGQGRERGSRSDTCEKTRVLAARRLDVHRHEPHGAPRRAAVYGGENAPLGGAPQALLYMYYISRDTHTSIGACCSESQEE